MYCVDLIDFMALILHFKTDQTSVELCTMSAIVQDDPNVSLWVLISFHQHKHVTIIVFGV